MKVGLINGFVLFFGQVVIGQQALFISRIYFEDSLHHKDSIEIGYDPSANDLFNPGFGEIAMNEPFDSVFEVRAAHSLDWRSREDECTLSKRIFSSTEIWLDHKIHPTPCFIGNPVIFFIKAKYWPVKISWNNLVFENTADVCSASSFILADYNYHLINPFAWLNSINKRSACMRTQKSFEINLDSMFSISNYPMEYTFKTARKNAQSKLEEIAGVELFYEGSDTLSPCRIVDTDEVFYKDKKGSRVIKFYPNPATDAIQLSWDTEHNLSRIHIWNATGKLVSKHISDVKLYSPMKLSLNNLSPGIYFIQCVFSDQTLSNFRLVIEDND
jgi:hypothetical protein